MAVFVFVSYIFINTSAKPTFICSSSVYIIINHSNLIAQILDLQMNLTDINDFDEQTRRVYQLTPALLDHTTITSINRAKLLSWLSEETSNQLFMRDTYALACYYVDLYFMKRNSIQLDDFQNLGLAALILAAKNNQSRVPNIRFDTFPKADLLKLQSQLIFKLNFYLNPVTYVQQLDFLFQKWDQFAEKRNIYPEVKYFSSNINSYSKIKATCQKMDCINLVTKIKRFQSKEVVLTLFYLQNKIFCIPQCLQNFGCLQEVKNQFTRNDNYKQQFNEFLSQSEIRTVPKEQIIDFIQPALSMKISPNGPKVGALNFAQYVKYMTKNDSSLKISKRIIQRTREI